MILDSDIRYATAFADYLNKETILEYTLQVFTDLELLLQFIHTERIAFALINELNFKLVQATIKDEKIPVICLTDSKELITNECYIFKYQSMHKITELIRNRLNYQSKANETEVISTEEQIITIISPSGSIESAVLALAVANYISKQSKTIYRSEEPRVGKEC